MPEFLQAVNSDAPIYLNREGQWGYECFIIRWIRWLFGTEDQRLIKVANQFARFLEQFEGVRPAEAEGAAEGASLKDYIDTAKILQGKLKEKGCLGEASFFYRRFLGLAYREEKEHIINGKEEEDPKSAERINNILNFAKKWKAAEIRFSAGESGLTEEEQGRLEELKEYPELVELLETDSKLRQTFFIWMLRDHCELDIFAQFPTLANRLTEARMAQRIGSIGKPLLKVKQVNGVKQVLCPFVLGVDPGSLRSQFQLIDALDLCGALPKKKETKSSRDYLDLAYNAVLDRRIEMINLCDQEREIFGLIETTLKVKDVFKRFSAGERLPEIGVEIFSKGIQGWNRKILAWCDGKKWHPIDLTQRDWWRELPKAKCITAERARKKYKLKHLDGKAQWGVAAVANQESDTIEIQNTHAYLELLVPNGKGKYWVYTFGRYPDVAIPEGWLEILGFLANTFLGFLAYPDESHNCRERKFTRKGFHLNEEQGWKVFDKMKADLLRARNGEFIYQFQWENCAKWVYDFLKRIIPELSEDIFKTHVEEFNPQGIIGNIWSFVKSLPEKIRLFLIRLLIHLLRPSRALKVHVDGEEKSYSVSQTDFVEKNFTWNPSKLGASLVG